MSTTEVASECAFNIVEPQCDLLDFNSIQLLHHADNNWAQFEPLKIASSNNGATRNWELDKFKFDCNSLAIQESRSEWMNVMNLIKRLLPICRHVFWARYVVMQLWTIRNRLDSNSLFFCESRRRRGENFSAVTSDMETWTLPDAEECILNYSFFFLMDCQICFDESDMSWESKEKLSELLTNTGVVAVDVYASVVLWFTNFYLQRKRIISPPKKT